MTALYREADGRPLGREGLLFTEEQAVAVTRRTGPMLLAANAGSGKTAVLAERFARAVVEDGVEPGELLAITFTEKAAGELRHRIRARLSELGAREAARGTDQAWISTIHGFCMRVLRAHAAAAGVDPAFEVLDETVARGLRADAFDAALAAVLDTADPETLTVVATWGADRLTGAVLGIHDALRSRGERFPTLAAPVARGTIPAACAELDRTRAELLAELAGAGDGVSVQAARDALARCAELLAGGGAPTAEDLAALRFSKRGNALKTESALGYLDALCALEEAMVDEEAVAHHALLDTLLRGYVSRYEDAKAARSGVDYDDLELLARDLLRDHPAIAADLARRFRRVMVDEFQDTNPRQLELLELLGHEDLFVVGDALQSIYGFRHADVRVFRRAQARHRTAGTEALLRTNWRTVPEILSTLNHALGTGHEGYTPLVAGRGAPPVEGPPATTLLLVDATTGKDPDEETARQVEALTAGLPAGTTAATALEARAIARWVREGVDAGEHRPQDVVLLMRAATDMPVYERALELEGLSTLASGGRGFWLRQQVQDLTAWLAALANPRDGHAMLSALASPLVGVDADGLAIISSVARRRTGGDVWRLLQDACADGAEGPLVAELRERLSAEALGVLTAFVAHFAETRDRLPWLALDELIERVVARTGYDRHVLALPGGPRRLANVHKLMRLAAEHETLVGRDLRSFIDRAREEAEAKAREPEAPVELPGVPAVRLMTVHAAKGLQFPVVVACDLERVPPASGPDVLSDGDRVGLRVPRHGLHSVKAFAFAELDAERVAAAEAEERRILHVALTRAENRLVMSAVVKLAQKDGTFEKGRPSTWVAEGVLGVSQPPAVLRADGRMIVGAAADAPVRVEVRWLDERDVAGVLPSVGQRPVDGSDHDLDPDADPFAALRPVLDTVAVSETPSPAPAVEHLSYSSLSRYERCGLRFHLEKIGGLRERDRPVQGRAAEGLDARARGAIVHRVLELHDLAGPGPAAQEVLDAAREFEVRVTDDEARTLTQYVARALRTPLMDRVRAARRVRTEATFTIPLERDDASVPVLLGVVDLVAEEAGDTVLVVDYKTDRLAPETELEPVVAAGYGIQRTIYALAALSAGAQRVDVAHLYLDRPEEPAVATFTVDDAERLRTQLRGRAAGILARDFRPTAEPNRRVCAGCPGRGGLCPVPVEQTRADPDAPPRHDPDGQTSLF